MEQDLPIDIHSGKLVDWLVSRRHAKKTWPAAVQTIREKINNAIQDMPEHPDVTRLLSGSYINYFHCLQIIDILRETEKESKNIFGWYTSQRMKDWQEIVKLYEADNVNLAEASQFLTRNVNHEIPSMKKEIAKCNQIQLDCDKKLEDNVKRAASAKDRYFSNCKKIGIAGDNLKEELFGLVNKLPEKFASVGVKVKELETAINFHQDYVQFIVGNEQSASLPISKFIAERGDVTMYEWTYGEAPISVERDEQILLSLEDDENAQTDGIDFGESETVNPAEIDFGDEVDLETGDIDWGGLEVPAGNEEQTIDFGDAEDCVVLSSSGIVLESSGVEAGVAKGEEAGTLLYNERTRTEFVNELLELQGFLSQRIVELNATENIVSMTLFSNSPRSLQYQNIETMTSYLDILSEIIQDLSSTKIQHLYMISSSPRYVDRLIVSLQSHLRESTRILSYTDAITQKREEACTKQRVLRQHLQLIVARTKELQTNVEKLISVKYNNRTVNIMGGIQYI